MEALLYRFRPHICVAFAAYAIYMGNFTPMVIACTSILLICGLYIFSLRNKSTLGHQKSRGPSPRRNRALRHDFNKPKTYTID